MAEKAGVHAKVQATKQKNSSLCKRNPDYISSGSAADRVLQLQKTAGNQAVKRLIKSGALQAKLKISQPNDVYEHEADRVAEQVMKMPDPVHQKQKKLEEEKKENVQTKSVVNHITPLVQRQIEKEKEEEPIQRKETSIVPFIQQVPLDSLGSFEPGSDFEAQLINSGVGSPLPSRTRAFMESRFGADFSGVRLHTDSKAAQLNRSIGAHAFTMGRDIYLGKGKNNIESTAGKRLLAHELTHTIQQASGPGVIRLAPSLPEFSTMHFVNGNFTNFDAHYEVMGPVPATGTLFISHGVYMNYPQSMKKNEQTTFENDFVKTVHDKWSNKHLLTLNETGFSPYQCNVDVTARVEKNPDDAHTVINIVKPKPSEKRFRSRVRGIDKKSNSLTAHKAILDFRDPTIEESKKINEADFIRDVGNFDFDSDKINSDCQEDIDKITDFIKQNAPQRDPDICTFSLQYTGRASSQGDKFYNKKLSERRINSVEKVLETLPGLCLSISVAAGEEEATEGAEFRRVSVGVFLEGSKKKKNTTQDVASHEFGHMIGLGDEYIETLPEIPGSKAKFFGDKPTHYDLVKLLIDEAAANELIVQDSANIMARGNEVKRGHYVMFVAAIDIMTRPEIQKATGKPDAKWNVV